jgi:hypothetical protein
MLSVSGISDSAVINCPFCKTKIRITVPETPSFQSGYSPELAEYEDAILESDVTFSKTLPMIMTIATKDIMRLKYLYLVLLVVGIFLAAFISPLADEIKRDKIEDAEYLEGLTPDERALEEYYLERNEQNSMQTFYILFIIVSVIILGFTVNYNYGWEIKRGTMRMLSLYPIDMNGLTLAKVLSASVIMGIIQFLVLFLPLSSLMQPTIYPWLFTVHTMTYLVNIFILLTAAFGSHIITIVSGRMVLAMNRLLAVLITLYIICTETFFTALAEFLIGVRTMTPQEANELYHDYELLGQALGQFSPYHSGGRMIASSAGFNTGGPDLHFVLIIGIALIIGGFILGKRIYLDVFIRE